MVSLSLDVRGPNEERPTILEGTSVRHDGEKRVVTCFCGQDVRRSIVPHLKDAHPETWAEWVQHFVELRSLGFPLKKIMRLYRAGNGPLLFSWTVIDRAARSAVESGMATYTPPRSDVVEQWEPANFEPAIGTVWDFPRRGNWAVHSADYRGNWPPQLVRNLILAYTVPGDLIVDAFVGGGTTLIEAWLCGRRSLGTDISKYALQTTQAKLEEMEGLAHDDYRVTLLEDLRPTLVEGDALELSEIMEKCGINLGTVDLLCAHPPYLDALKFTDNDDRDLSSIGSPELFYRRIGVFADQALHLLTPGGTCALLIGDVRKGGHFVPLAFNSALEFQRMGFTMESIVIKTQNHERSSEFYRSKRNGSLLLEHEYLFIFRKEYSSPPSK